MFEQTASASAAASMGDGERAEPTMRPSWPGWDAKRASERIAEKAAEYRARRAEAHARNAYADSGDDADALPGSDRWNRKKTIIASACGLVLLAGAAFYLQLGDSDSESTPSADHSVSGVIDSKIGPLVRGGTEAPAAPAIAERRKQADVRTLAPGDALQGVRAALDQHDLGGARARLKALSAQQQARVEYESLKDELVKRELQRDAALQLARACERTSAWACVQQNAGEALALDGSNVESQAMLERVISHAGWLAPSASAALAKKVPSPAPATAAATPNTPAARSTTTAPAQANVAPAARPNVITQRPADRRTAQRSAAAHQSAEEARAEAAQDSRAEKIARGQAATNAITATTILPPIVATTRTPPQSATQSATPPAPPQSVAKANPAPTTQAPAARAPQPHYIGEEESQPAAAANPHAPYYIGEEPAQPAAPAARTGAPRAPYYLGEDPPQPAAPAPAPRSTVPRPPQPTSQGGSLQPSAATMHAVPRPPAASAQPVATVVTPRVPPLLGEPSTQSNASTRAAQPVTSTAASPQFANTPAGSHIDSDKSEELERAIKQYGWSSGDAPQKPSR
ncbi:zinc ribbon domain-containing protein [Caballeronia ptereochthonis]|nr:zinc ribbon domain-containing protein [Caballeronia ptereochthonis]